MYALINEATLRRPLDDDLLRRLEQILFPQLRAIAGLRTYYLIRAEETKLIAVMIYESAEALEGGLTQMGAIWQTGNLVDNLKTLPVVSMGEVIAHW